jgi:hypothetical protein
VLFVAEAFPGKIAAVVISDRNILRSLWLLADLADDAFHPPTIRCILFTYFFVSLDLTGALLCLCTSLFRIIPNINDRIPFGGGTRLLDTAKDGYSILVDSAAVADQELVRDYEEVSSVALLSIFVHLGNDLIIFPPLIRVSRVVPIRIPTPRAFNASDNSKGLECNIRSIGMVMHGQTKV